jgi:hypothetical protein
MIASARANACRGTWECAPISSYVDARDLKREQAQRKAKKLVALVQGNSGLEGQAVDQKAVKSMVKQTTHELLAGSKRKLWSEERAAGSFCPVRLWSIYCGGL